MIRSVVTLRTITAAALVAAVAALAFGCSKEPVWKAANDRVIAEEDVATRTRDDIPDTGITPSVEPGTFSTWDAMPKAELAPGVTADIMWGTGELIAWVTLAPGAELPRETLASERIMVVWNGSVDQLVNGSFVTMSQYDMTTTWSTTPHRDFVYLQEGTENAVKAGPDGALILELYSPIRADYLAKAGITVPANPPQTPTAAIPSVPANTVLNYYDVQFVDLSGTTSNSRLISGRFVQASFLSIDPLRVSPYHNHPEEQFMTVLRGSVMETAVDQTTRMTAGNVSFLPGTMVHRGEYDSTGCDILDVFWPVRPDFIQKMNDARAKFHAIIPEGTEPVLIHDGAANEPLLYFTEGPSWINGELIFSNMWFSPTMSEGSPARSNTLKLTRDGKLTIISKNMQTNGTMPLGNGNLAVCDMFGHRVIEMTPAGRVVRTLASEYNGVRFDGPNDLVVDAKGGIYITDPQFTPGLDKTQPGKSVFYRRPSGEVIRVVEAAGMGNPNGILLSPDGRTCYIANTRGFPIGNYIAAFDVNEDGTLANMRQFAKLFVEPQVLDRKDVYSGADGMTIDTDGNLYVATNMGIQIFDASGAFIGIVNLPIKPISIVFGGDDLSTIYCTCPTSLYAVKTNKTGLTYPIAAR